MTDQDSQALAGEIVGPEGDGQWLLATVAGGPLGVAQKTVYRMVERGQLPARRDERGRLEVWVKDRQPDSQALSPVAGVNLVEVSELLAPLVQALTDSQRQSEVNLERAIRAEMEVERLTQEVSRQRRLSDNAWQRIRRWWAGTWDSQ